MRAKILITNDIITANNDFTIFDNIDITITCRVYSTFDNDKFINLSIHPFTMTVCKIEDIGYLGFCIFYASPLMCSLILGAFPLMYTVQFTLRRYNKTRNERFSS